MLVNSHPITDPFHLDPQHSLATRRSDTFERTNTKQTRRNGSVFARSCTHINPMTEDETYAARYHSAFIKKDS